LSYEVAFLNIFLRLLKQYSPQNVCITGGGALNVLINQKIKNMYNVDLFIPPNPNDCGLSLGAACMLDKPKDRIEITYKGLPILDIEKIDTYLQGRNHENLTFEKLAKLLKEGKIVGIIRGDSEVGPRALGNRSIICDPSFKDMKDILNAKVKFREWYRPFAPFCKLEDASKYFESKDFTNFEYMSYAPIVKEQYKEILPSITHVDGTARLQCVTYKSHQFMYDLLTEFAKLSDTAVLLNTSFNIRGNPILSTIEDALYVLDNTQLDCVVVQDILIYKN
jgi:carbamoyltransferase